MKRGEKKWKSRQVRLDKEKTSERPDHVDAWRETEESVREHVRFTRKARTDDCGRLVVVALLEVVELVVVLWR